MTLLFKYPTPLQNDTDVTSRCTEALFGGQVGNYSQTELQCIVKSRLCHFVGGLDIKKSSHTTWSAIQIPTVVDIKMHIIQIVQ